MAEVKEALLYSESHEWVKVEGEIAIIGISDFAQHSMGDITYVDMPAVGDELEAEEDFGALESVKASSELVCPLSGAVVEVNEELEDTPELINKDPYGSWIIKLRMSEPEQLKGLLSPEQYSEIAK